MYGKIIKRIAVVLIFAFILNIITKMHVYASTVFNVNSFERSSAFSIGNMTNGMIAALDPLTVAGSTPTSGNTNAPVNGNITVTFNRAIQQGSSFNNIKLLSHNIELSMDSIINGSTITIIPRGTLVNGTTYSVVIPAGAVKDIAGNELLVPYNFAFTTGTEKIPPEVITSYPSNDTKYVAINSMITVIFSEGIVFNGNSNAVTLRDSKNSIPVNTSASYNSLNISLSQSLNMAYNTTYTLTIQSGAVKDWAGNAMKANYIIKFTTENWATKPKVIAATPSDGATGVEVNSTMAISYNEKIQTSIKFGNITLFDEKNNKVAADITIDNNILKVKPASNLSYDSLYRLVIPYGAIKNLSGNISKDTYEFIFRTAIEKFPPKIISTYPAFGSVNTAIDSTISILFDENIEKSNNFSNIMLRDSKYNNIPILTEIKDNMLFIKLSNNLNMTYNTQYSAIIPYDSIKDKVGNSFSGTSTINFTTGNERFCPIVKYTEPATESMDINVDATISIVFNDAMQRADNFNKIALLNLKNENIEHEDFIESDTIKIKLKKPLDYNTQYKLIIPLGALKDSWGNMMKNEYTMTFTTAPEKIPPVVLSMNPKKDSTNVDIKSTIDIKFNENIQKTKNFENAFLVDSIGKRIEFTAEVNKDVLTIKPITPLAYATPYSLSIPKEGISDMAGNVLKEDCMTCFFTVGEPSIKEEDSKNSLTVSKVVYSKDYSMIAVYFSENIKASSGIKNVTIKDASGKSMGIPYRLQNNMLIVKAISAMALNKKYSLFIPKTAVTGVSGKTLKSDYINEYTRK